MTKADIVNEIAKSTGIDKMAVLETVEKFMDVVKESLTQGENVYLRGFGSFIIKTRSEKTARNISKNTTIIIPAHKIHLRVAGSVCIRPADNIQCAVSVLSAGNRLPSAQAAVVAVRRSGAYARCGHICIHTEAGQR